MEWLVFVALVLVSEAWGLDRVVNWTSFRQGEDVNLTCGNKTWTKDKIMYIIWTLNLKHKTCKIRSNREGDVVNNCLDHKSLRNTTEGQPVLHIPHFSSSDVGNYTCDSAYTGGAVNYIYHVNVTAPPVVSSWIEANVAVCLAERANPAASITWSFTKNVSREDVWESDGLISVQSFVEVSADEDMHNLSCTVSHPYWDKPRVFVPELKTSQSTYQNRPVIYITVGVSVAFCLILLLWGIKKLHNLRKCQKSSIKSPPEDYVEEVEPYDSYVQRVNSIYNSSRDLFA